CLQELRFDQPKPRLWLSNCFIRKESAWEYMMELRTKPRDQFVALKGNPISRVIPIYSLCAEDKEVDQQASKSRIGVVAKKLICRDIFNRPNTPAHPLYRLRW